MTIKTPDVLERYRTEIDSELRSVLDTRDSPLYDMMRYHLGWVDEKGNRLEGPAGKALRPTLCLLACEAVGGQYHLALPVAAAIELLHNYSLIHDDVQDDDCERRHRPTVWAIWGKPQAINAGTAMRILTNIALSRLDNLGLELEKRLRVQRILDETTLRLIEGQYLDISYEKRLDIDVEDYLSMIGGKTATLIACALETGALLGTNDESMVERYHTLGWNLGLGFQIKDDILGIWGDSDITGKPLASDIYKRKKTLPVVRAMEIAQDGHRELLEGFFGNDNDNLLVPEVLVLLEKIGAQEYAHQMADSYCREARLIIDKLDLEPDIRQDFEQLIDFLEERAY